jgi:hypothetical protein
MKNENFSVKTKGLLKNTKIPLAKLYMFLLTDGGVSIGNGKYETYFVNSSNKLLNYFSNIVRQFSDAKIHKFVLPSGQKIFRLYDKDLSQKLLRISNTLRTKPCERFPSCPKLRGKTNKSCKVCKQTSFENTKYLQMQIV